MIFGETGSVGNDVHVLGLPWTPVYLLDCRCPALFEAGFTCVGRLYEEDARKVLKSRQPEILFLTHVHYDHCGAASYFKKVFPGLKVAASPRATEIIKRPNAQRLMKELNAGVAPRVASVAGIDSTKLLYRPFEPFEIDLILEDGQVFQLTEDISVKVFAAEGHTRDMLSYYIPEKKILFATEAFGNIDRIGQVICEFLVDYDSYVQSIKRLSTLDIEVLCLGHQFVVTSPDVKGFLIRSREAAERFKATVEKLMIEEEGVIERIVARIKAEEYDINPGPKQLEQAYLLNLTTRVTHLAKVSKGNL